MHARPAARPWIVALFLVLGFVGPIGAGSPIVQRRRIHDCERHSSVRRSASKRIRARPTPRSDLARGNGYAVFLTTTETVLSFAQRRSSSAVIRMTLIGATGPTATSGLDRLPGRNHDLGGFNPRRWRTDISTFGKVRYEDVYRGLTSSTRATSANSRNHFIVAPRADPSQIRLRIEGADDMRIDAGGDLAIRLGNHEVRQRKPRLYQGADRVRREVSGGYELTSATEVRFTVGGFDVVSR